MTAKVWIEVALNGPWGHERQPGIPVREADIIADGIAAARAGAAIVHLHAYDEVSGRQRDDWRIYARLIEGIRAKVDAIVYPTIPIAGSGFAGPATSQSGRYAHLDELGKRGLVEWGVVDPGSVNFASFADIRAGKTGFTYLNPDEHVCEGLAIAARHGLRPSYAIYEPGFARLGAALAAIHPGLPTPIYRLMFSDTFALGFPPTSYALDAYLVVLRDCAPGAPVMVAGLGVDIRPLIAPAVERGAHIHVGLEDAPFGDGRTNATWVEEVTRLVRAARGEPATVEEVRAAAKASDLSPSR